MSGPERIAIVLAQTHGGIGRHASALVREVTSRGGEVEVLAPAEVRVLGFEDSGAIFRPMDIPSRPYPTLLLAARRIRPALAGAGLVHAHGLRAGAAGLLAARRAGIAHRLLTIHNAVLDRRGFRACAAAAGDRLLARLATTRICVSRDLAETHRSADPRRADSVLVIPVGSDLTSVSDRDIEAAKRGLGLPAGTPLLVSVGRLHRQKGFDLLIEAASLISSRPAPLIVIAGEGPELTRLHRLAAEKGVADRIRLLGPRGDAAALIASADLFCMPSRWEGSPLALHEAMAYGRPIVASRIGGIPDMLTGESALLVPPEKPAELAAAIDKVLGDPSLATRLGRAASERAKSWPDARESAAKVADLYETLLGAPLGGSR